ncbi:branched-chain amino acid transporter [Salipaludibacillus keqinensis]|uniref:Branched-chain amino acid transporter n=1 Tax=Salipaludibacillus keqinensis TaxID=2045207 RepID=A0A323TIZ1_9BACI|nr:AzlD domain-containing protein [Salipaludibacillus keqinensis]PYZ93547.1 branched-chain amino acid transporter [Salipaludibacillus keqinensis]
MNLTLFWMIVGMAIVTYIPRLLPLVMLQTEHWPDWSRRMLSRVPYAVLGALIFPGILYINEAIWFGLAGGMAAIALAYIGAPLILVVGGAIAFLTIIQFII